MSLTLKEIGRNNLDFTPVRVYDLSKKKINCPEFCMGEALQSEVNSKGKIISE